MDDRIVDKTSGNLTEVQKNALQRLLTENTSILQIIALSNITAISDAAETPRGLVVVVPADSHLDPTLLPERMLSVMSIYNIKDSDQLKESDVEKMKDLMPEIRKVMGTGPSLDAITLDHIDRQQNGKDSKRWQPSLGKAGFISIAQHGARYDRTYRLCIFSTNETLSGQLFDSAETLCEQAKTDDEMPTFGEFMRSPEYVSAKSSQRRNNDRLAMEVANVMGFELELSAEDRDSIPDPAQTNLQIIARPNIATFYDHLGRAHYTVQEANSVETKDAVVIYSKAGSINTSVGGCAVPLDPIRGVSIFKGTHVENNISINALGSVLLCGVGHSEGDAELKTHQRKYIAQCIHWDGKQGQQMHTKAMRNYRPSQSAVNLVMENAEDVQHFQLEHVSCYQAGK